MSVLFEITPTYSVECARKIMKEYSIDNAYAINMSGEDTSDFKYTLYTKEITYGIYPRELIKKSIDPEIIAEYAAEQIEAMNMMYRHGKAFEKYSTREKVYYKHLEFWSQIVREWDIKCVFFAEIPHEPFDYLLYHICKKNNIRTIMYYMSVELKKRFLVSDYKNQSYDVDKIYKELLLEHKNDCLEDILLSDEDEQYYNRMRTISERGKKIQVINPHKPAWDKFNQQYKGPLVATITEWKNMKGVERLVKLPVLFYQMILELWSYWKEFLKTQKLINYYEKKAILPIENDKYIFYALHYQPECTSSPLGGLLSYQINAIKMLSFNSPDNIKIYVKEHPAQISFGRDRDFYNEVLNIPKVVLISQKVSSIDLIRNCIAVATLTGTVALESKFFNKPVMQFGYYITQNLPGTYCVKTNLECQQAIQEILHKEQFVSLKETKIFIKALEKVSYNFAATREEWWNYVKPFFDRWLLY